MRGEEDAVLGNDGAIAPLNVLPRVVHLRHPPHWEPRPLLVRSPSFAFPVTLRVRLRSPCLHPIYQKGDHGGFCEAIYRVQRRGDTAILE